MSKVVLASQLPNKRNASLAPGLKQRHVTMLSIAGVIGAGLFVGSGHAIAAAGPAALLAYLIAGTLVVLVMRMLGEMAVASPDTGSFSTYADRSIGRWAGFTIGWLYWWFWVLVIPLEAIAAAAILNAWFPAIDTWIFALAVTFLLTVTNLFSVARYGEFEFWFALLKVIAIIAFIVLGAVAIVGGLPEREVSGLSSLMASHGGFVPNGYGAVLGALLTTMFSFMGTEIVTIAAAESKDPAKQITRATNSVIWRIGLFYLVSIFIVISIVPWNDPLLIQVGSYQRALEAAGHPARQADRRPGGTGRRGQLPELGDLHLVADGLLPGQARRRPERAQADQHRPRTTPGGAGQHRGGLPHHHRQLLRTGEGLHLPPRQAPAPWRYWCTW